MKTRRWSALLAISVQVCGHQAALPQQPGPDLRNSRDGAALTDADLQRRLQKIDGLVIDRMGRLNLPGYCLAIIESGRVVFQKPYGYANLATQQPTTNDTVFGLASVTKTFTALTLLSLVDRGLVGLDDPLAKYIPDLTPAYQPLTIRQLASMTAGVPDRVSREVEWRNQLEILDHAPLESAPGSAFLYSNFSYRLLGSVIARVTGRPFLDVVGETILGPLQMNSTSTTVVLQSTGRVAQGYGNNAGRGPVRAIEYKNPAVSFSAGMLASTSNDLVNYVFGLLSRKIISQQGYETLWYNRPPLTTGQPCKWAFGWSSVRNPNMGGQLVLSMNGGTRGVASSIIILPESNSAVIGLCNLRGPQVHQIAHAVARIAFGDGSEAVEEPEYPGAGAD